MNQASTFDTHKSFKRLVAAGLPENQAEAIIECQSSSQSELAAKVDIARLEADLARLEVAIGWLKWVFMWGFGGLLVLNVATLGLVLQLLLALT